MNVVGPGTLDCQITNNGTVNFLPGPFTDVGPSFDNYGTVNLQADDSFGGANYGFWNEPYGTFKKTGGGQTSTVSSSGFYNMGFFFLNSGTVSLTGSTLQQYEKAGSGFYPQTELNGGGLSVANPYLLLAGWPDGVGTINGQVDNGDPTGVYTGAGVVHPGLLTAASGTLNITGDYWQMSDGTLRIDANGPDTGVPLLNVQGTTVLSGTLHVIRNTSFTPALGSSFAFLRCRNIEQDFNSIIIDNNGWTSGGRQVFFAAVNGNQPGEYDLVVITGR
jgi:hypothetical protein